VEEEIMAGILTKREPRSIRPLFRRGPLYGLQEEMQDLFSQVLGEGGETWLSGHIVPSLDLSETDQAVDVRMDVPGMKPDDIDIQVNGNLLTVSGENKEEKEEKGRSFHRIERRCGSFSRSVTLPCAVKEDKIDAKYLDGVLTISMPKSEEAKSRKIKVKS